MPTPAKAPPEAFANRPTCTNCGRRWSGDPQDHFFEADGKWRCAECRMVVP